MLLNIPLLIPYDCAPESPIIAQYLAHILAKFIRSPYVALSRKQSRRGSGPE